MRSAVAIVLPSVVRRDYSCKVAWPLFLDENLAALRALLDRGFHVFALPMKIAGGTGGPLRIIAGVPSSH